MEATSNCSQGCSGAWRQDWTGWTGWWMVASLKSLMIHVQRHHFATETHTQLAVTPCNHFGIKPGFVNGNRYPKSVTWRSLSPRWNVGRCPLIHHFPKGHPPVQSAQIPKSIFFLASPASPDANIRESWVKDILELFYLFIYCLFVCLFQEFGFISFHI